VTEHRAAEMAREQARTTAEGLAAEGGPPGSSQAEITAWSPYLQRLGTDIRKSGGVAMRDAGTGGADVKLSDVMSNAGLAGYAEVALVSVRARVPRIVLALFRPSQKAKMDAASRLPSTTKPHGQPEEDTRS